MLLTTLVGFLVLVPDDVEAITAIRVDTGSQTQLIAGSFFHWVDVSVHIKLDLHLVNFTVGLNAGDYTT